jgi:hypothetical protein
VFDAATADGMNEKGLVANLLYHKNKRYYFESTRSPSVFWVNLAEMNFAPGNPAKKLTLTGSFVGEGLTPSRAWEPGIQIFQQHELCPAGCGRGLTPPLRSNPGPCY